MTITEEFTESTETAIADAGGRVMLGPKASLQSFRVSVGNSGALLLVPIVAPPVPDDEAWLYSNPAALQAVRQGLDDAANGRVHELGSFAQYAEGDIDD